MHVKKATIFYGAAMLTALVCVPLISDAASPKTPPLIRGTLWYIVQAQSTDWTQERLEQTVEAQKAVGFDVLWVLNTPDLVRKAEASGALDIVETVYALADARGMHVIADLPVGGWYGKAAAEAMITELSGYAGKFHARYGKHSSFYGWYLNHEINPIAPEDAEQSAFWRNVWRTVTETCHTIAPGSVVTISPFFLLDEPRRRGFIYLTPQQYADWWGKTLSETGIDILMLQDSGEHLSFLTLAQREPFWTAVAEACHTAGAQFWLNVESGEADVPDWETYLTLEAEKKVPWRFTPMDWLREKLELASKYADSIINWGYFPYMDPHPLHASTNQESDRSYRSYRSYFEKIRQAGGAALPELPAGKRPTRQ
ncbi:MAG TPA: DUF4434 domain-containing protein [Candidatus Hydrogenedentes bacterium]|nr:DUF4434 domain-containing protein [Candidatus Hydrogenedentota bacterium]